jgi:hypothetical protein
MADPKQWKDPGVVYILKNTCNTGDSNAQILYSIGITRNDPKTELKELKEVEKPDEISLVGFIYVDEVNKARQKVKDYLSSTELLKRCMEPDWFHGQKKLIWLKVSQTTAQTGNLPAQVVLSKMAAGALDKKWMYVLIPLQNQTECYEMVTFEQVMPPHQAAPRRQVGGNSLTSSDSDDFLPLAEEPPHEPPHEQVELDSFLAFSSKAVEDTNALIDPQGWVYIAKITTLGQDIFNTLHNRYTIDCTEGDPGMYLQKIREEEMAQAGAFKGYVMYAKEMRRALNAIKASVEGNGLVERVWYTAKPNH